MKRDRRWPVDTKETFRTELKRSLADMVDEILAAGDVTDFSPSAREATVQAMRAAAQDASTINNRVGPFYSTAKVRSILGNISRQAVSERARNHTLLRLVTADNTFVYPAFQFVTDPERPERKIVNSHLVPLLRTLLGTGADPWTVAFWLTAPLADFDDQTALAVINRGEADRAAVHNLAREDAARWQSAGYEQAS